MTSPFFWLSCAITDAARELLADVRLAMKRADLSQDYVARCIGVPTNKLSDQLNGKTPFTSFWRFFAVAELRESDFAAELLAIQAARVDRFLVGSELNALVVKVSELVKRSEAA